MSNAEALNDKKNEENEYKEKTLNLFDNDNFVLNNSDEDEYTSNSYDDNEEGDEDEDEVDNDEEDIEDAPSSDNMSYDDLASQNDEDKYNDEGTYNDDGTYNEDDNYNEENKYNDEEGSDEGHMKKIDGKLLGLTKRMKKIYINKKENIYHNQIGIYKNEKLMKNEDIEDRMKYLIILLNDTKKNNIKIERSIIINELLFYYTYYYEYSKEMIKYLYYIFDIKELYLFLEINNMPKEIHLRTNTLKITRNNLIKILKNQNVSVQEGESWNNVGIIIKDVNTNVGSLNEYLYGYYIIQSSSSLIPVLELDIQENDMVLDMCAAPGGKCTYMCTLKKNKGVVYANDINKLRCKAIEAQASRMGINNLIVTCIDALKIQKHLSFQFDKILLDAPCSGTGVVNKNKAARRKTIKEIRDLAQKQKILLNNAINLLKNGGILVYSTCSISVEENEQVINHILKKRDVNLLPTNINIGDPGITQYRKKQFSSKISLCKRIYLHKHNHDNFFIAKLIKRSDALFTNTNNNQNKKKNKKNKHKKKLNENLTNQKKFEHNKNEINKNNKFKNKNKSKNKKEKEKEKENEKERKGNIKKHKNQKEQQTLNVTKKSEKFKVKNKKINKKNKKDKEGKKEKKNKKNKKDKKNIQNKV
ncbi:RNA methyltransferase, putative [Plasmodium sp. DRC-Itaito]|uniref:RNA methyltransferase, putative n=1 Tax=Plasmodium gaboni TaxID=647221 RepID=A0ABY1UQ94_9APIC|nr:RNA methyltransferase, putative [Plasmodium gaboni]SOV23371.1 RNA methyltransferase, putative [Plasmodium sp. DRC-Itaito]